MSSPADILGHRIRDARKDAGLSQTELAQKIGLETHSSLSRWERGERLPPDDVVRQIAEATDRSTSFFYGGLSIREGQQGSHLDLEAYTVAKTVDEVLRAIPSLGFQGEYEGTIFEWMSELEPVKTSIPCNFYREDLDQIWRDAMDGKIEDIYRYAIEIDGKIQQREARRFLQFAPDFVKKKYDIPDEEVIY